MLSKIDLSLESHFIDYLINFFIDREQLLKKIVESVDDEADSTILNERIRWYKTWIYTYTINDYWVINSEKIAFIFSEIADNILDELEVEAQWSLSDIRDNSSWTIYSIVPGRVEDIIETDNTAEQNKAIVERLSSDNEVSDIYFKACKDKIYMYNDYSMSQILFTVSEVDLETWIKDYFEVEAIS